MNNLLCASEQEEFDIRFIRFGILVFIANDVDDWERLQSHCGFRGFKKRDKFLCAQEFLQNTKHQMGNESSLICYLESHPFVKRNFMTRPTSELLAWLRFLFSDRLEVKCRWVYVVMHWWLVWVCLGFFFLWLFCVCVFLVHFPFSWLVFEFNIRF